MAVKFKAAAKKNGQTFIPGVAMAFEDDDAEGYLVRAGFAEEAKEDPVVTFPVGTWPVDTDTTFADGDQKGRKVMEGTDG